MALAYFMTNYFFHYTTFESALRIIESLSLKAARPEDLNDPFECDPRVAGKNLDISETMSRHLRLISGSKRGNILPMWTHYASDPPDYCTGVVIKFDLNEVPFVGLHHDVIYSNHRVVFDWPELSLDEDKQHKKWFEIARTKDKSWEYENELRIVIPTRLAKSPETEKHFSYLDKELFLLFSPESIKTIYCGINMSDVDYKIIARLVASRIGTDIPIIKTRKSAGAYDLWPFTEG